MNNMIIKLEDVDKFYMETGNKLHILKKLNLEVKRGEFVSILGKSGSGKSTLLNIMGLLDKIDGGKIWIDDKEVSSLNETERNNIKNHFLGFVFQFHYLMSEFTALENVMIPALLNNFKNKGKLLMVIPELKYLERGGRIGKASSTIAGALNMKPILTISQGEIAVEKKVLGERIAQKYIETYGWLLGEAAKPEFIYI